VQQQQMQSRQQQQAKISSAAIQHKIALINQHVFCQGFLTPSNPQKNFLLHAISKPVPVVRVVEFV
jgi:hypothetical protein